MASTFDIADSYWQVAGVDNFVWSSKRLAYVSNTDAEYVAWLSAGNEISLIESRESLAAVMQGRIPSYLAPGLPVTSISNSNLNGTYAMDGLTMSQIGSVARDVSSGMGFPQALPSFDYPDITGSPHTFNETEFVNLYKVLRDYVSEVSRAIQLLALGNYIALPVASGTIP